MIDSYMTMTHFCATMTQSYVTHEQMEYHFLREMEHHYW